MLYSGRQFLCPGKSEKLMRSSIASISHTLSSRDAARTCSCEVRAGFSEGRFPPNGMGTSCPGTVQAGTKQEPVAAGRSRSQ